jgi:hypothetical protein
VAADELADAFLLDGDRGIVAAPAISPTLNLGLHILMGELLNTYDIGK